MSLEDIAQEVLLTELDNHDWDMSEDGLDQIATKLQEYFSTLNEAREFVEINAAAIYKKIVEESEM